MYGVVGILILILSAFLFKKAAGTLSILKLNIINMLFYSMLVFQGIGTCIVAFGFREHYLLKKVLHESSFYKGYIALVIASLLLPLIIMIINKVKNFNIEKEYDKYLKKEVLKANDTRIFKGILMLTIIGVLAVVYILYYIGYIPLIEMFLGRLDFAVERINISRGFAGNEYIKNLLGLLMVPFLSYISYAYMRTYKTKKWKIVTLILVICSIILKTSDFSKSPVIMYIAGFILIEIIMNKISFKKIIAFSSIGAIIIIGSYTAISGYSGKYLSLTNGPLSRTLMTQTGTMFLHFDAFQEKEDYLMGQSFPSEFDIFNKFEKHDIRSGRVVMEKYNKSAVQKGIAGVMNTIYIGEAYANFGFVGVVMSTIWIAIVVGFCVKKLIASKKNPLNIAVYTQISMLLVLCFQGGVIDYFYNISILFILMIYLILFIFVEREKEFQLTKKILYINFVDLDSTTSGSSVRPKKIYDEFIKSKFKVTMLTGIQNKYKLRWKKCIEFFKIIQKNEYDICYIEPPAGPIFNICDHMLILYISFIKKIPTSLFYRDAYWKLSDWYDVQGIKRFILISMHKFELIIFRISCKKIYFASESVSLEFPFKNRDVLSPGCEDKKVKRKDYISNECIYVGGVSERYGTVTLLEAFRIINEEYKKEIKLNLLCREVIDIISKYKEKKWVDLYLGLSGEALIPIYTKSDIAIIPFQKERYMDYAIPIKLLEYIENEIPIVSTNCNEVKKFIENYQIGEISEDNPKALADAIIEMYNQKLNQYGKNIMKAKKDNLWNKKIEKIYLDLVY